MSILRVVFVIGAIFFLFVSIGSLFLLGKIPGILFFTASLITLSLAVMYMSQKDLPDRFSSMILVVLVPLELSFILNLVTLVLRKI